MTRSLGLALLAVVWPVMTVGSFTLAAAPRR